MSSKTDKAQKQLKEKHQAILNELLREDPNRYCADCEAKGPRWSSWNIGLFLCIRCAGIHRNLGVHISKVKSVNLDSWTPEQIEHIQKWGNKRAKECYECYLPEDFQRPHGDAAMEQFIRNKYERKLYKKKDGEPPPNKTVPSKSREQRQTPKSDSASETKSERTIASIAESSRTASQQTVKDAKPKSQTAAIPRPHSSNANPPAAPVVSKDNGGTEVGDLLSLDDFGKPAVPPTSVAVSSHSDLFGVTVQPASIPTDPFQSSAGSLTVESAPHMTRSSSDSLLMGEPEKTMSTKESILSLYKSGSQNQQKLYNVPGGMYMTQQQPRPGHFSGFNPMQNMRQPSPTGMMMQQQQRTPSPGIGPVGGGFPSQQPGQMPYQQAVPPMNQLNLQMHHLHLSHSLPSLHQKGFVNNPSNFNQAPTGAPLAGANFSGLVGHAYTTGPGWGANKPMLHTQQPIAVNGPAMGYGTSPVGNMPGQGHTMSTQLWK